jgi:hypothetical protein
MTARFPQIRVRQRAWPALVVFAVLAVAHVASCEEPDATDGPEAAIQTVTLAQYKAQLGGLRELVSACRSDARACDAAKVGSDDRVDGESSFNVHWSWLRELVAKAKDGNLKDRDGLLGTAAKRLDEQGREAGLPVGQDDPAATGPSIPFSQTRAQADKVLAGAEFRKVTNSSFWQQFLARLGEWLDRRIERVASLGEQHRWLGPVIEWGFVALALVALLVWVQRAMQRQRLAIKLESAGGIANWQEASRNWAALAHSAAEKEDWRDAVHSLYWASVTELEGRRVWRQNNARTPREYLRLLQTNAPQYRPLRQLTQALERIWYGLGQAERSDYDQALKLYEELRVA